MAFKKTCFECGAKEDKLYEGKCLKCFKQEFLPIKEIKEMNLKVCNQCRRIHYNNGLYTINQIEEMLPVIVEKRIVMNKGYTLKSLQIANFEVINNKLMFDIEIDSKLKE